MSEITKLTVGDNRRELSKVSMLFHFHDFDFRSSSYGCQTNEYFSAVSLKENQISCVVSQVWSCKQWNLMSLL